jgi:subtilisin family serine protease
MSKMKGSTAARLGLALAVILSLFAAVFPPAASLAQAGPGTPQAGIDYVSGEVLVKFSPDSVRAEAQGALAQLGVIPAYSLTAEVEVWKTAEGSELAVVERLNALPGVEYAQPNYIYRTAGVPNDPAYGQQWAHQRTYAEAAWDFTTGSSEVIIAVLDTGVDDTHPEFAGKLVHGKDFIDGDNSYRDYNGHGTHVAGIAAGQGNNGAGIAGVNWGARIMPVQVLNAQGSGYTSGVIDGIEWAVQHGARVINLSLSGPFFDQALQNAITAAHNSGALVLAAMGNEFTTDNSPRYPAAMTNVLAVAATDRFDGRAFYSNTGPHADVSAPGGEMSFFHDVNGIYSTTPTYFVDADTYTSYDYFQGTSMATPYVAGLAALIFGLNTGLTPTQVEGIIKSSSDDLGLPGADADFGYGRVNVLQAVQDTLISMIALAPISNPDGDGNYLVDWTAVNGATGYELDEDDNPTFSSPSRRYNGPESQFQVTGQPAGVWHYRVRAIFGSQPGNWSSTRTAGVVPAAPVLKPVGNPDKLDAYRIEWVGAAGASGYRLEEADNPGFTGAIVRYQGPALKYDVTGQRGGKTWYYRVRAYNLAGSGAWSASAQTEVRPDVAAWPDWGDGYEIQNDDRNGRYEILWHAVSGAVSYILEQSLDPYFAVPQKIYDGTGPNFSVTGQAVGTWYYRVRAVTSAGMSPWSAAKMVKVDARIFLPVIRR